MALSLNNLGLIYGDLGRIEEALGYLRRSLAVREEIGDRQGAAVCHQNLGQIYAKSGDHRQALSHLSEALDVARRIQVKEIQRDVYLILSDTYEGMGDTDRALDNYRRYKRVADEMLDEQTARQLAELQARFELERKDREIEVLRTDQEIQRIVRNVFLGGSFLLVLLVLLIYNRYRLKERANQEMQKANEALKLAQAEREKAARAELAHVSRLGVMGELATALAHELNQPLTAILSNAQATRRLVAATDVDKHDVDEALGDIVQGAGRARDIIQRLRELVRRREITREPLRINGVLRDVELIARADAEHHDAKLVMDLAPDLPTISGDRIHLQQVVLNLVHNSVEAMDGSEVAEREVTLRTRAQDERSVVVEVADTGPGADPDVLTRMFDPFFTTKSEGLGMGLTICSSIIEAHGGRLWATANSDRGLTVGFTVPGIRHLSEPK
jgi:C4-dicarboxylate-specific signal transduction histidine kinase